MSSMIISIFNIAKPYLIRIGAWVLEKVIRRGALGVARLLTRRMKAMKRRAYRMTKRMLREKPRNPHALGRLRREGKMIQWLHRRRENYGKLAELLRTNAAVISKNVAQRLREFAEGAGVPKLGTEETFEKWEASK